MVTNEMVEQVIISEKYFSVGDTLTICVLTLKNGVQVTGEAHSIYPEDLDMSGRVGVSLSMAKEKVKVLTRKLPFKTRKLTLLPVI